MWIDSAVTARRSRSPIYLSVVAPSRCPLASDVAERLVRDNPSHLGVFIDRIDEKGVHTFSPTCRGEHDVPDIGRAIYGDV